MNVCLAIPVTSTDDTTARLSTVQKYKYFIFSQQPDFPFFVPILLFYTLISTFTARFRIIDDR